MEKAGEKLDQAVETAQDRLDDEGPAESTGEKIDEAIDSTGEKLEAAGEKMRQSAQ